MSVKRASRMIKGEVEYEPIHKLVTRRRSMEERTLCPIGLFLCIVASYIKLPMKPLVSGLEPAAGGTNPESFVHKQYWPIQIRPPPLFSRCFRTLLC